MKELALSGQDPCRRERSVSPGSEGTRDDPGMNNAILPNVWYPTVGTKDLGGVVRRATRGAHVLPRPLPTVGRSPHASVRTPAPHLHGAALLQAECAQGTASLPDPTTPVCVPCIGAAVLPDVNPRRDRRPTEKRRHSAACTQLLAPL